MSPMQRLKVYFPEKIPATYETRARLPYSVRLFLRGRLITELGAKVLLNDALADSQQREGWRAPRRVLPRTGRPRVV